MLVAIGDDALAIDRSSHTLDFEEFRACITGVLTPAASVASSVAYHVAVGEYQEARRLGWDGENPPPLT